MFWKRTPSVAEIDPADTHRLLKSGEIVLIDVREPAEFTAERIDGAISMPLSRFSPAALAAYDRPVVLSCLSGARSGRAAAMCRAAGRADVRNLRGGLSGWKAADLPTRR